MRYLWPLLIFLVISFFLGKGFYIPVSKPSMRAWVEKDGHQAELTRRQNTSLNGEQSQLFYKITHELRCMVCQNQSLSDSLAPVAIQLREQILEQIKAGKDQKAIINFAVARYGAFVLYEPPLTWETSLLWFGPLIVLAVALVIVRRQFRVYSPK